MSRIGLDELERMWNAEADRFNQWDELGLDEIIAFAVEVEQKRIISGIQEFQYWLGSQGKRDLITYLFLGDEE